VEHPHYPEKGFMVWREGQKLGKEVRFEEIGEEFKVTLEL